MDFWCNFMAHEASGFFLNTLTHLKEKLNLIGPSPILLYCKEGKK